MDERRVDVGGTTMAWVEKGSGMPLLLIHGNTGSRRWFERVMEIPGARTIAPDLPNFGASGPLPGAVTIDAYADAMVGFMKALGIAAAWVAGHSLGGTVAMSLAVRYEGLVRGLFLVDSSGPSGLATPVDRHPLIELMRTRRDVYTAALRAMVPTLQDADLFERLVDDGMRMAAPAWIGNAEALGRCDYAARCAAYRGPVIVAWGRQDGIITEAMARETAAAFPEGRLVIMDGIGHSLPVEDPARFVALARELIGAGRSGA